MVSKNKKQQINTLYNQIKERAINEERVKIEKNTIVYSLSGKDEYPGTLKIHQPKNNKEETPIQISREHRDKDGELTHILVYTGSNNGLLEINQIKFVQHLKFRSLVAKKGETTKEQNNEFTELLKMYATNK